MRSSKTLLLAVALTTVACSSEVIEPAPLSGGETLTYAGDIPAQTVTIEKTASGFTLNTPGSAPESVAANLRDGRKQVATLSLSQLWLEPSQRKVGGQTPVGKVVEEVRWRSGMAWKLAERNGQIEYWFDKETGFLLQRRQNPNGPAITLTNTTIPGLKP